MTKMTLINGSDDEHNVNIVVTVSDVENLREEIAWWTQDMDGHPEIFFKFENYPEVVSLPNIEKATYLVGHVTEFYRKNPTEKYWLSLARRKLKKPSHGTKSKGV